MAKLYRAIAIIKRMLKYLPPEQHYLRLAKKPVSAVVLCFNDLGQVLMVKTHYRDFWMFPGGSTEESESPSEGAKREVKEEIGIDLPTVTPLIIEYFQNDGREYFNFVFYGDVLNDKEIAKISLQEDELTDFGFFSIEEVEKIGSVHTKDRIKFVQKALQDKQIIYLENGNEVV